MVAGSIYSLLDSGWTWGWFSTPSVVLGMLFGPGLLFYRRWARLPSILLFTYWFILGAIISIVGSSIQKGIPLMIAGLIAVLMLWQWSESEVVCEKI